MKCEQHDYIEIACTYSFPVKLTLRSGAILEGVADDTGYNDAGEECIKIAANDISSKESLVAMATIATLEVTIDNPHFRIVNFAA